MPTHSYATRATRQTRIILFDQHKRKTRYVPNWRRKHFCAVWHKIGKRAKLASRKSETRRTGTASRWVYTFDAVKRRLHRHALRWFAALAGAFRLVSACASVVAKRINPRAYVNFGKS